jgi:two-component system CheB/CheR fusion protein
MAFVLVQHLAPRHESALTELLRRATDIPVTEVKDGMVAEPDCVYVIPPNVNMGILNGRLHLMPRPPAQQHLPIDFFMRSLAEELGNKAIGVILSGTASDGTLGMKAIKAEGGITFAQDTQSAKYSDMPRNAIATGCIDFVLPPDAIAREIMRLAQHAYVRQVEDKEEPAAEEDVELRKIFALLRTATGVDFANYKHSTLKRRIRRRMLLHKFQTLKDYIAHLQQSRAELDALYQDILIHVTGFFRDPDVFDALKTEVFPNLIKGRPSGTPLRIWVPGCSSGEEVYSIAMCLLEFLAEAANSIDIQIFATDISEPALERARAGVYLDNITAEVSLERLRRFFVKSTQGYQINKAIRDICVFARQDLSRDPPFSRLDLISCRNLLIYLGSVLQKRVVPIFHYALKPNGYLLLGNSETIGGFGNYFTMVDKKHKIYVKKQVPLRLTFDFPQAGYGVVRTTVAKKHEEEAAFDIHKEVDRVLLSRYTPPGVVVNEDLEILQFRGRTGAFLEPAPGQASLSLPKMAREGLVVDLRAAIQKARQDNAPTRKLGVPTKHNGRTINVNIQVEPIKGPSSAERYFLVLFEEAAPPKDESEVPPKKGKRPSAAVNPLQRQVTRLTEDLGQTKSTLQSIIEEHETTNEELKSANEEILSSNEELQSTNEELETAKEELQSTNEELTTLNEELQNRNLELSVANNDLLNLLASVNIPMLMLGNDLRIRHFTPPAEKLLNLIATDVGRPISDLKPNVNVTDLEPSVSEAIDTVSVKERDVQDPAGRWYSMRIRPYKTSENKIDGAVITWIDITTLKQSLEDSEKVLREVAERYRLLFERNLAGVFRATPNGRFLGCNAAFARIFGFDSPNEITALRMAALCASQTDLDGFVARLRSAGGPVSAALAMCRKDGSAVRLLLNAVLVKDDGDSQGEIEGIALDVTEHHLEEKLN